MKQLPQLADLDTIVPNSHSMLIFLIGSFSAPMKSLVTCFGYDWDDRLLYPYCLILHIMIHYKSEFTEHVLILSDLRLPAKEKVHPGPVSK